ncbi:pyridoxal-dependent decarboxylase [Dactylosporangium salmoneum]|uniref:Histidine decarboxylase n=1 Tax=Dactylosporangium salmoneum TaxID=53361 RepID=A0ABN3GJA2_9ACTN
MAVSIDGPLTLPVDGPLTAAWLRQRRQRWVERSEFDIGYPNAVDYPDGDDFDLSISEILAGVSLNNVGHPFTPTSGFSGHSLPLEQQLIRELGAMFRCPPGSVTGFVTSGSTESVRAALLAARRRFRRRAVVYASTAAHTCVAKVTEELCLPLQLVPAGAGGGMDYAALTTLVAQRRRGLAVVVVATIGTTMVEAVDDVPAVHAALDAAGVPAGRRWVHADAALAGIPLAMLDPADRPGFDFGDGADSLNISGHKYLAVNTSCSALVLREDRCAPLNPTPTYTGAPDLTPAGSRSGHTPVLMLAALHGFGTDGLRSRAETCRSHAAALVELLTAADVPAWRHKDAFTVVFPAPSDRLRARWPLPVQDGWGHVICMPGKPFTRYERFAAEYLADRRDHGGHPLPGRPTAVAADLEDAIAC